MNSKRRLRAVAAGVALAAVATPSLAHAAVQVGSSGWEWGNPLPQGNTIRSMSFAGPTGFAAGDFGTLLKTTDGGATWSGLQVGSFQSFTEVQALSASTVIAGGGCVARRSDDGGKTFTRMPFTPKETKCPQPLVGLSFVDPKTGWLLLGDGTVTQTTDGGATYSPRVAVPGTAAAGGKATPTDLSFISPANGFAISSEGKIYASTDAGQSWKVVSDTQRQINDIQFVDPTNGFAVGNQGIFLRTKDGGQTWAAKDVGAGNQNLTSIRCADANLCVMATQKGDQVVRTTDGGDTSTLVSPSTDPIYAAAFASPTQLAAAGANGSSVVSVDGGVNFTPVGGRLQGKYFGVRAGGVKGSAYAPGDNGHLAVTTDAGKTWKRANVATSEDVADVSFPSANTGYALDTDGGVFKTTNGGTSWSTLDTGTNNRASAILATSDDNVLTVGPVSIRRSTDGGSTFVRNASKAITAYPLTGIDRAGSALFVWGEQDVAVSKDAGKTWTKVLKPGKYKKFRGKLVNKLEVAQVDFSSATKGFMRDSYGRIFRTANGGRTWTQLLGVGTDDAVGMAFSSASKGYLVIRRFGDATSDTGYLLRTDDGGDTWHPQFVINSPIQSFGIAAPGGDTDYLLGGDSALLSSTKGGDAGSSSQITLSKVKTLKKPGKVTISGKLSPGVSNQRVTVSYLRAGWSYEWDHVTVDTAGNGSFTTTWNVPRGTSRFVVQWAGDFKSAGDGSKALDVVVAKKK